MSSIPGIAAYTLREAFKNKNDKTYGIFHMLDILFCSITPTNLGQLLKPGAVSESALPEDSKTVPGS